MNAAHGCAVDENVVTMLRNHNSVCYFFPFKPLSTATLFLNSHIPEASHHLLSQAQVGVLSGP